MNRSLLFSAAACVALGCTGLVTDPAGGRSNAPSAGQTSGTTATTPPPVTASGFRLPLEQPLLLPFSVRLARVAAVTGLPATDPLFNDVRANRTTLGDHDYANGVKADNSWTALRMSLWVKLMKPICASPAMKQKYPALPENLGNMIETAYGRAAEPQDTTDVQESLAGLAVTGAAKYDTLCLGVLSSMELLAQ